MIGPACAAQRLQRIWYCRERYIRYAVITRFAGLSAIISCTRPLMSHKRTGRRSGTIVKDSLVVARSPYKHHPKLPKHIALGALRRFGDAFLRELC